MFQTQQPRSHLAAVSEAQTREPKRWKCLVDLHFNSFQRSVHQTAAWWRKKENPRHYALCTLTSRELLQSCDCVIDLILTFFFFSRLLIYAPCRVGVASGWQLAPNMIFMLSLCWQQRHKGQLIASLVNRHSRHAGDGSGINYWTGVTSQLQKSGGHLGERISES